ncbi:MAG TPA: GNAT family N-acetyltransferase [Xanthobacteraceae bacterium]|nr:GNAT family N-acetyltransferase [Xanthobacteraceae bacterium]
MGMILRPYRPEDFESSVELWMLAWQAALPEIAFAKRLEWWRARWQNDLVPNNEIVVAESGDALTGFVVIDPKTGWLDQFAVDPAHWGTDVASALMDEAKRISPSFVRLDVNQVNGRAVRFYEREGFTRTGEGVNKHSGAATYLYEWRP